MSKQIDTTKIERIRAAAVTLISEQGISNASVALIARHAGVSVGYLYRHYASKEALFNDMLEVTLNIITEKILSLIEDGKGIDHVVSGLVRYIFEIADQDRSKIKFLIVLLNDFSATISTRLTGRIRTLADRLLAVGLHDGSIREDTTIEDIYMAMVGLPMQYLSLHYRGLLQTDPTTTTYDIEPIIQRAIGLIRNK